jgi:hypothetical protein
MAVGRAVSDAVVAVGATAVGVDVGVLSPPPQAAATINSNIREARLGFTSLMLLSRPALGHYALGWAFS